MVLTTGTVPCAYFPILVRTVSEIPTRKYWDVPQDLYEVADSEFIGQGAFGVVLI